MGTGVEDTADFETKRLVDQKMHVTKLSLDLEFGCECTALHFLSLLYSCLHFFFSFAF